MRTATIAQTKFCFYYWNQSTNNKSYLKTVNDGDWPPSPKKHLFDAKTSIPSRNWIFTKSWNFSHAGAAPAVVVQPKM